MDGTTRRICSHDPQHDLTLADETAKNCPICGHRLVVQTISETVTAGDDVVSPEQEEVLPEPAIICCAHPEHDVSRRAPNAEICPQPSCGARLIQLQCQADPSHDIGQIQPTQTSCPVCSKPLVTPICTNDVRHSMLHRVAGQDACPVCGARVRLDLHKILQIKPVDPTPTPNPQTGSFWKRLMSAWGLIGYFICWGLCYLLFSSFKGLSTSSVFKSIAATFLSLLIWGILIGASSVLRSIFRLFKPS